MRAVVVGAGWTGLGAATLLRADGHDVVVLEAASRVGGRIATTRADGYLVEHGPHAVLDREPAVRALAEAAGVHLVAAPPRAPRHVVRGGRPHALPSSPPALLRSPLVPLRTRLRLLAEPFVPPGPPDQTLARLVRRRLGPGALPLADAMATGVYAGDPERLVAADAFPELARMDAAGGLLRGLRRRGGAPPRLVAPRDGMQAWAEALAARLDVRLATPATAVRPDAEGVRVETPAGAVEADLALVALDPPAAARLLDLRANPPPRAEVAVVAFGVRADAAPPEGYGVLAPEVEGRFILGALYESALFPGRAPPGHALVRTLVGGRRHPDRAALPDAELVARAWADLRGLGVVDGAPAWTRVVRTAGIPQPEASARAWRAALARLDPRIRVLGIGHRAVGLAPLAAEAEALARSLRQ